MFLEQFGEHLVKGIVGVGDLLSGLDGSDIDYFDVIPVVEELVKSFSDVVNSIGAAMVVDGSAFFLDAYEGELKAFQVGEILFVFIDGEGFSESVFSRTDVCGEALLRHWL